MNSLGGIIEMTGIDRFMALDLAAGTLQAEAGVTLSEIMRRVDPFGFFIPVSPGTRFIRLGGAIAGPNRPSQQSSETATVGVRYSAPSSNQITSIDSRRASSCVSLITSNFNVIVQAPFDAAAHAFAQIDQWPVAELSPRAIDAAGDRQIHFGEHVQFLVIKAERLQRCV